MISGVISHPSKQTIGTDMQILTLEHPALVLGTQQPSGLSCRSYSSWALVEQPADREPGRP